MSPIGIIRKSARDQYYPRNLGDAGESTGRHSRSAGVIFCNVVELLKVPPATVKWCDREKMALPYLDQAPQIEQHKYSPERHESSMTRWTPHIPLQSLHGYDLLIFLSCLAAQCIPVFGPRSRVDHVFIVYEEGMKDEDGVHRMVSYTAGYMDMRIIQSMWKTDKASTAEKGHEEERGQRRHEHEVRSMTIRPFNGKDLGSTSAGAGKVREEGGGSDVITSQIVEDGGRVVSRFREEGGQEKTEVRWRSVRRGRKGMNGDDSEKGKGWKEQTKQSRTALRPYSPRSEDPIRMKTRMHKAAVEASGPARTALHNPRHSTTYPTGAGTAGLLAMLHKHASFSITRRHPAPHRAYRREDTMPPHRSTAPR
ncbi:hypothetical protein B0H13DRAFT_1880628 [Mycena leptocephala]|nr:hypothetical protein B0H13DRAFT_1880628 [Mycena leptocephala]